MEKVRERGNMKFYGYLQLNEKEAQKGDLKDRLEVSGTVNAKNRINLQDLLKRLKRGDRLVITDIDRLGGSRKDAISTLKMLWSMDVYEGILDVPGLDRYYTLMRIDEYKKMMELFLYEEEQIVELQYRIKSGSTLTGMKRAVAQGKKVGRKRMIDPPEKFVKDYKEYKSGYLRTMSLGDFLKYEGILKSTYYNYERRLLEREKC